MKQTASLWLYTYWNNLRNGRKAPNRFEIEPMRIGPLLPETFILETGDNEAEFRFRLAGTRVCDTYGLELKGLNFVSLWQDRNDREALQTLLMTVKHDGTPGVLHLTGFSEQGDPCRFEILLLPLVHADETINRIMGILSPIDMPYWLGTKRLTAQNLDDLDLIWPDVDPQPKIAEADEQELLSVTNGRIVKAKGRVFRVLEGGLTDA
jgi:hypothetical protein